ncbi:Serine carboxypeptidase-like protein [Hordeum vulgare]|nr:Serine carboxypeptidase-like protein [Hordeum vulgare]
MLSRPKPSSRGRSASRPRWSETTAAQHVGEQPREPCRVLPPPHHPGRQVSELTRPVSDRPLPSYCLAHEDPVPVSLTSATVACKLFYFFFESRRHKKEDPVVIWLRGGPSCSSELALFYENSPFHIADNMSLLWNEFGWDQESNLIYVDQPTGTGFSYSFDSHDTRHNEAGVSNDLYDFLQVIIVAPVYVENDFYITGESYVGHYIPSFATRVYKGNKNNEGIHINLKSEFNKINKVVPACEFVVKLCADGGSMDCVHIQSTAWRVQPGQALPPPLGDEQARLGGMVGCWNRRGQEAGWPAALFRLVVFNFGGENNSRINRRNVAELFRILKGSRVDGIRLVMSLQSSPLNSVETEIAKAAKQSGIEIPVTRYPIGRPFGYPDLSGLKERILDEDYIELDDDLCKELTEYADPLLLRSCLKSIL